MAGDSMVNTSKAGGSHLVRFLRDIKDFSGSTRLGDINQGLYNPLGWLKQIERLKDLGGVSEKEVLIVARDHMIGKAAAWFDVTCNEVKSWSAFTESFKRKFCVGLEDLWWSQIRNLRQAEDEDVDDVDVKLRELFTLVGVEDEKLKIRSFLDAINPAVALEVERAENLSKLKDLESVVVVAARIENVFRKYGARGVTLSGPPLVQTNNRTIRKYSENEFIGQGDAHSELSNSTMSELLKEFRELKISIVKSAGNYGGQNGARSGRQNICFYCKKEGHRKAECPDFLQIKQDAKPPANGQDNFPTSQQGKGMGSQVV